jgi:hypothetical protein
MTTYNLSAFAGAGAQFFDDNGSPLVGGKLYSYAAGTTTLLTTYTTSAGTVANTNPIILNAGGRTPNEIWQATGILLKFVLYNSDNELIGSYDGIPSINDPFGINSQLSSVAGTNSITATATPTLTAYATGAIYSFIAANTNSGAATLSIDGLTATSITKNGSVALSAGDIQSGKMMLVEYDGTTFQLVNNIVYGGSITNGTIVSLTAPLGVSNGGTGASTLTANNVLLGNGVAALQTVAPGASGSVLVSNGTTWVSGVPFTPSAVGQVPFSTDGATYTATQKITQGTVQASTSGTSIDFTGIPSWVKRITVMFNGVSTNGSSSIIIQLGISSGPETTSYSSTGTRTSGGVIATNAFTTGFAIDNFAASSYVRYGSATISLFQASSNAWTYTSLMSDQTVPIQGMGAGYKALAATLDRVRITTVGGTDTFDAGSVNILYE